MTADAPLNVLLLSGQRAANIGDVAMRRAALDFIRDRFSDRVQTIEVFGPAARMRGEEDGAVCGFHPIAETLLPILVRMKRFWVKRHSDTNGGSSPTGWASPGLMVRLVMATSLLIWLAFALVDKYASWVPIGKARRELFGSIRRCDLVLSSGGGWMNSQFLLTLYEQLFVMFVASRLHDRPILLAGEQVGPAASRFDRWLISRMLERADFIGCREPVSQRYVNTTIGLATSQRVEACLFGDWAFQSRIPRSSIHAFTKLPFTDAGDRESFRVGIHLRQSHYSPISEDLLVHLAAGLSDGSPTPMEIHLIPTCQGSAEEDEKTLSRFRERFTDDRQIVLHEPTNDPRECQRLISSMHFNVGVSYHFCLFSLMSCVPCVGIATSDHYRWKLGGLFEWFGLSDWVWEANSIAETSVENQTDWLSNKTRDSFNSNAKVHRILRQAALRVHQRCRDARTDLAQRIEGIG